MKAYHLIGSLGRCVRDSRRGHGSGIRSVLGAAAVLLIGIASVSVAAAEAVSGAEAQGAGVAPGAGVGSPSQPALPRQFVFNLPDGCRRVVHNGNSCFYGNGIYYCPVFCQGTTIYEASR